MRGDDVIYDKVDKYVLSGDDIRKYTIEIEDGYNPSAMENGRNYRLLSYFMNNDFMYNNGLRKQIKQAIINGDIVEGDDMEYFINKISNHPSFMSRTIDITKDRIKYNKKY